MKNVYMKTMPKNKKPEHFNLGLNIENKSKFSNELILSMVEHIIPNMEWIVKSLTTKRIRMVISQNKWGCNGVARNRDEYLHRFGYNYETFIRFCFHKDYLKYIRFSDDICDNIRYASQRFYGIMVHELKHIDDYIANSYGADLVFSSQYSRYRRPKWETREEEKRANKCQSEFDYSGEILTAIQDEIIEIVF